MAETEEGRTRIEKAKQRQEDEFERLIKAEDKRIQERAEAEEEEEKNATQDESKAPSAMSEQGSTPGQAESEPRTPRSSNRDESQMVQDDAGETMLEDSPSRGGGQGWNGRFTTRALHRRQGRN